MKTECKECDGLGYFPNCSECCGASIEYGICMNCLEHAENEICETCDGKGYVE